MPLDWEYRFDSHHPHMVRAQNDTETAWPLKTFSPLQNQTRITNSHRVRFWLNPQTRKKAKQWIADRIGGSKSTNPKNPNTTSLRTAQREMDCDSDSQISTSPKIKNRSWASRFAEEPRFTETIRVTTLTLPHIPTWWKFCRNKVSFVRFSFWSTRFVFLMVSFFFFLLNSCGGHEIECEIWRGSILVCIVSFWLNQSLELLFLTQKIGKYAFGNVGVWCYVDIFYVGWVHCVIVCLILIPFLWQLKESTFCYRVC